MKYRLIFRSMIILLFSIVISCTKNKNIGNSNSSNTQLMFYVTQDCGVGNISVTVNGTTQVISGFYSSTAPACAACAAATFSLTAGSYTFSAVSQSNTLTWNGTVTVQANKCNSYTLNCTGNSGGCNTYSLNGTWIRQNDGTSTGTTGMVVVYSGNRGIIQSVGNNSNCFTAGAVKWQNLNSGK